MDETTKELLSRYKFKWADTWDKVKELVSYCKQTGYFSHDWETSGHHPSHPDGYPTILSVAFQPYSSYVVPIGHFDSVFRENDEYIKVIKYIGRELVQNSRITKVMHNAKFEMEWWAKYGIKCRGVVLDTMLLKYTLNEEKPHGLKPLVEIFFPEWSGYSIKGEDSDKSREELVKFWSNVPLDTLSPYCALDSDLCLRLAIMLEPKVIKGGFYYLYRNLLEMATYNLAEVEMRGYHVDVGYLDGLVSSYQDKISTLENKMRSVPSLVRFEKRKSVRVKKELLADLLKQKEALLEELDEIEGNSSADNKVASGIRRKITNIEKKYSNYAIGQGYTKKDLGRMEPINMKSPKQLIEFLFSEKGLGLPILSYTTDKKTKKETKTPATDEETLLELKNIDTSGFIDALLEYRQATKLYSTYVIGIRDKLNPDNTLHGSFLVHGTVTGRLSSTNPNLQNMPRDTTSSDIKHMFICPPGKVMMQLDYSQAELRVASAWAQEKQMLEWFRTNKDVHLSTCLKKYHAEDKYDEVKKILDAEDGSDKYVTWKTRRKQAKTINFGILYGQTAKKLSNSLSSPGNPVSVEEAQEFLDDWFKTFPKMAKWITKVQRDAETNGYVRSPFGRKRRLPWARRKREDFNKYLKALRDAVNAPVQGTASDYALFSSILIRERIMRGQLPKSISQIGTIHDSIMFYLDPKDMNPKVVKQLFDICNNPDTKKYFGFTLKGITMKVDFELGLRWNKLKGYHEDLKYEEVYKECYQPNWWENKETKENLAS